MYAMQDREHSRLPATYFTYHGTGWYCVPFQPKRDEGGGDQNNPGDKYSRKVERSVSSKY